MLLKRLVDQPSRHYRGAVLGLILAAGKGGRMGGPKARLLVGERTLAKAHAERMQEAGATRIVVALGPDDATLDVRPGVVVESTEPEQSGSLARALTALAPAPDDVVLVTPVDALPARIATIHALVAALARRFDAAVPTYGDARGHPIAARASVLLAGVGRPLREVLADLGERRALVGVDDPAVTTDLDTPDAVERALGGPPRFSAR